MVLYRFGSTGVVQLLTRAAELLGLVPVFPVRNINTFSSGSTGGNAVFRDCVLVKKSVGAFPTCFLARSLLSCCFPLVQVLCHACPVPFEGNVLLTNRVSLSLM